MKASKIIIRVGLVILSVVILILIFLPGKNDNSSRNNYQTTPSGEHEHLWLTIIEDNRTCLEEITATYQCRYCEETKTEVMMPAPGHSYSGWSDIIRDSCLESGYMERKCTVCGEIEIQTTPPRTSHNFSDYNWVTIKESTCTEEGIQECKCTQCDEKETRSIPTAHNYVNGVCDGCNRGIINIIIPETPITVHDYLYGGRIDETCKITSITLKAIKKNNDGSYRITFVWAGEKTYDDDGNNYTSSCGFAYKLYDSDGYVVHSSSVSSVGVAVGEKFRNEEFGPSYIDLDPDETYTMEILNLD